MTLDAAAEFFNADPKLGDNIRPADVSALIGAGMISYTMLPTTDGVEVRIILSDLQRALNDPGFQETLEGIANFNAATQAATQKPRRRGLGFILGHSWGRSQ